MKARAYAALVVSWEEQTDRLPCMLALEDGGIRVCDRLEFPPVAKGGPAFIRFYWTPDGGESEVALEVALGRTVVPSDTVTYG